ncbi:dnan: DNA polymerase III, beta subunit [Rubrobacter radiotolerans]|uniref:Beta sliding clamp n=1 Tax=Rubrobacter radiotolerans TaxID=42256 RepID=A0A023WZU0_RUBRA|nr:DNA polymerase III subunit beta [Rubrobacter radiotolerans]AHY45285.1 dnan: DNA polymerase III, beta subunit [Rubrobacter radiotolerans]MDX5892697.1 DNA polymerase III subunit beta [Rubrobacter radiotolerans]SMC02304.1 DNA polymerase-3 subunit beta [Rubrobacter radiotolerans DSM 5868]
MKVVCNTEQFGKKLALVSRGVSARSTIQLLGGVLVETGAESVKLSATDVDISIRTSSPAEVEEEGRVVIPARIFNDVVRSLPGGQLRIEHDVASGTVRLAAGEKEYSIRAYAADEFPQLPEFDEARAFRMTGEALVDTIEKVSKSYSRDETRPVLTGILINFENSKVRMVTTDSYRLSIKETELATTFEGERTALIPARAMQEVQRIFTSSDEEQIEIDLSENQALFRIGDVTFGTRLIGGNFPEYGRLLPNAFERKISVNREELMETLRRVNLFAQRQNPPVPVSLAFSEGEVEVMVRSPEVGEAHEKLPADSEDEFRISFNPGYLIDGVSAVDTENVVFKLNEPLKPGLIVPNGGDGETDDPDFLYLIMPMRDPSQG